MNDSKVRINRQTLRRLRNAVVMFLRSPEGTKGRMLLAVLLLLMLLINGMNVANSYVGRYFMSAIERREMDTFVVYAWCYAGVFALSTVVAVFFRFTEERLALLWREWMTNRIIHLYITSKLYLHLETAGDEALISNPDQRMSEDVRALTATTLSFVLMMLNSTLTAVSFAGVLWGISPTLFFVSVSYAALGSLCTVFLGRPLLRLNYQQSDLEANFRSELIRVRENAEEIARAGSEAQIRATLEGRVEAAIQNLKRIIGVNRNLNLFTTGYNYMIQLVPILFVAPYFIREGVEFGIIGQSAMAFSTIVGAFSLIVTQFQSISGYATVVTRLGEFVEVADEWEGRAHLGS